MEVSGGSCVTDGIEEKCVLQEFLFFLQFVGSTAAADMFVTIAFEIKHITLFAAWACRYMK